MAEQASSFIRDWITRQIQNDPTKWDMDLEEWAAEEVGRLKRDARSAGLDLTDPEFDDGSLHDDVIVAIGNVFDPEAGGIKD